MKFFAPGNTRISLNTRLSVGVAAIVLATTFGIGTVALQLVKNRMQASIASEQFARMSAIANAVDQKFVSRRILLKTLAESVASHDFNSAAPLQAFLEQHPSLRAAFDNVVVLDVDGDLVANLNGPGQLRKLNIKDRAHFRDTVASGAGVISQPYRNRLNDLEQVAITEPVRGRDGRVLFVISGSINLKERNILGELADERFGQTGYVFITTTDGVVINHPLADRVLKQAHAAMADDVPDIYGALGGFEGTMEGVNYAGVRGLYAFKRLRQADWIMGAMYPRHEAFARIDTIERTAWGGAFVLALLAGALALGVVRRLLRPLTELHRNMLDAHASPDRAAAARSYPHDEIGDLSRTFDQLMQQRQASEKFLRDITDNLPAMVAYFDCDENCLYGNSPARRRAGLDERAALDGVTLRLAVGEEGYAQHAPYLPQVLAGKATQYPVQVPVDGREAHFQVSLIPDKDLAGRVLGFYLMTFNVTALKEAERQLIELARLDVLTGLPNRLAFNEQLPAAMSRARRSDGGMALMFLDIDHFKAINDTLGHAIGDGVLAEYARRLRCSVRETDTVVRLAGDEFVVVLENVHSQDAVAGVAQKIVAHIQAPVFHVEGRRLDLTTSIGIVFLPMIDATVGAGELLARADTALYAAKAQGRNRFAFFS